MDAFEDQEIDKKITAYGPGLADIMQAHKEWLERKRGSAMRNVWFEDKLVNATPNAAAKKLADNERAILGYTRAECVITGITKRNRSDPPTVHGHIIVGERGAALLFEWTYYAGSQNGQFRITGFDYIK